MLVLHRVILKLRGFDTLVYLSEEMKIRNKILYENFFKIFLKYVYVVIITNYFLILYLVLFCKINILTKHKQISVLLSF